MMAAPALTFLLIIFLTHLAVFAVLGLRRRYGYYAVRLTWTGGKFAGESDVGATELLVQDFHDGMHLAAG